MSIRSVVGRFFPTAVYGNKIAEAKNGIKIYQKDNVMTTMKDGFVRKQITKNSFNDGNIIFVKDLIDNTEKIFSDIKYKYTHAYTFVTHDIKTSCNSIKKYLMLNNRKIKN